MSERIQMFVLPFAGGNAMSFAKLEPFLDPGIEMIRVEYAGRLARRNEDYIEDYDAFLKDVAAQIRSRRKEGVPYVLFGYSLGSVLIYDLLAHGEVTETPKHAFICAKGSLLTKNHKEDYGAYPEGTFLKDIVSMGGIDQRIADNERFLSIYMEPVRKDFLIWGQFVYRPGKIPCDISVIYGKDDPETCDAADWSKLSDGKTDFYGLSGTHFFINEHWRDTAAIINDRLAEYLV